MKPALLLAALALVLATPVMADPAAGPSEDTKWTLTVNGDGAILTYAIPDSDDSGPGFSCPGGGDVDIYFFVEHREAVKQDEAGRWLDAKGEPGPWTTKLTITSGKVTETLTADVDADEMNGGSSLVARVSTQSPVLQAFGQTGKIVMEAYGEKSKNPPAPRGLARRFVSVCSK
ncbi:hypothetical protein QO010_000110 [Caulobacter ginsengisoli]|uniref:Uncharacterized protein n=1 Tax=Caulobacter ginsengisoli TaxID=400775 RepID=A0ABU0IN31_9CAUL|nr:hypothetical protein [Caulobacter ginsengisoli]MDQ0462362.1 hypothetical protein [Caulobacter ginsengisoli]